jgi:hypothetical protein
MARILLAWEIGDGNGHVRNLLAVADLLRAAGHQAIFVMSATQVSAKNLAEANGYPVEQILLPHYPAMTQYLPPMANYRADSFLDVMGIHAFDSEDRLAPMLARYRIIIEQNAIDVVIAETAPVAWLAARIANRPCLGVGTSFGLPEVREGFATYPQFDNWPNTPIFSEESIMKTVSRCVKDRFSSLREALAPSRILPLCYPALDHYGNQRSLTERGVGPVWQLSPRAPVSELRGFAYLQNAYPAINDLVSAIRMSGIPFTVYVRNGKFSSSSNMEVKESFNLEEEMNRASFILHHGSAGFGQAALSAGIAQCCFPFHVENTNNAYRLQSLGVSKAIGHTQSRDFLPFLLETEDNRSSAASVVASQLDAHRQEFKGARVVAAAVDDLL